MSVYVDRIKNYPDFMIAEAAKHAGQNWSHMYADTLNELFAMASVIGLKQEWFQNKPNFPHFDLVPSKRKLAIFYGAIEHNDGEFVEFVNNKFKGKEAKDGSEESDNTK